MDEVVAEIDATLRREPIMTQTQATNQRADKLLLVKVKKIDQSRSS